MTTDTVGRFERSLVDLEVGVERASAADASERIDSMLDDPAVGVPLPFEDVAQPESVDTNPTGDDLAEARTGVTPATFAIAEYGTVAIESRPDGDEPVSLYPDRHVAVVAASDVVDDIGASFERLESAFAAGNSIVFATGRSATADMGSLVHGVHGPGSVDVLVLEDR
ncbi:L-lactate dehydrogenase complex protein LldG [Natronorubrum sediminis]|uniref:L-lactate dehydrogenase complex protein LldG n=1 Tax=Natronorubrum sediminis TaxID=640943 RepID=A0A1H6FMF7_9EURY|nr:LUD domain-containing protein [Natronorubrum sediminis]SEH11370.1 L-lactate dehydrogenase complex protein LldG [Natronorubrum sediminis]